MANLRVDTLNSPTGELGPSTSELRSPQASPNKQLLTQQQQQQLASEVKGKKAAKDLSAEFAGILSSKIEEIERTISTSAAAERECGKLRKKQLREVQKYVADRANSVEDRIAFVQSKYSQQVTELLRSEKQLFDLQKENEVTVKERDKAQSELKKTNVLKDKLEELCRQLQRENREVAEENRRRNEEELKQRQGLQAKFTQAINDVTVKMDQQQAERAKQVAENESLREKLNQFLEQFESFNQLVHKKDLELQLANAKFDQQAALSSKLSLQVELLEKVNDELKSSHQSVFHDAAAHAAVAAQNALLLQSNAELKEQLEMYYGKFAEFQSTLSRSNEMFDKMKGELEGHAKVRASFMRERDELKQRADKCDLTIVQLLEDRQSLKKQVERLQHKLASSGTDGDELRRVTAQKAALENLCRVLQAQVKGAGSGGGGGSKDSVGSHASGGSDGTSSSGGHLEGSGLSIDNSSISNSGVADRHSSEQHELRSDEGMAGVAVSGERAAVDEVAAEPVGADQVAAETHLLAVVGQPDTAYGTDAQVVGADGKDSFKGDVVKGVSTPPREEEARGMVEAEDTARQEVGHGAAFLLPDTLD